MNRTDEKLDELQHELAEFRQTVRADFAELRQEMNNKLTDLREEMRVGFAKVEASAAQRQADFMKWTLGFWVASLLTYIGALVALAKVIR